jgi:hypothetical protein
MSNVKTPKTQTPVEVSKTTSSVEVAMSDAAPVPEVKENKAKRQPRAKSSQSAPKTRKPRAPKPAASKKKRAADGKPKNTEPKRKPAVPKRPKSASERSRKPKEPKVVKKRIMNTRQANLDKQGIGIAPARVKNVLTCYVLNRREYEVKRALVDAENKPKKPKPTPENPNPEVPAQGLQIPVARLRPELLEVINAARDYHEQSLQDRFEQHWMTKLKENEAELERYNVARRQARKSNAEFKTFDFNARFDPSYRESYKKYKTQTVEDSCRSDYERHVLEQMDKDTTRKQYKEARKQARAEQGENFDLHKFNLSYDKNFYAGLPAFRKRNNEWAEASELVSKTMVRVSVKTRYELAAFLDQIVVQYVMNGINNCLAENKRIVQLRHALSRGQDFDEVVPLDRFVRSLDCYQQAVSWVEEIQGAREKYKQDKKRDPSATMSEPEYPTPSTRHEYTFDGYILDICRSVRMRMAERYPERRDTYLMLSNAKAFKSFCSNIVYETILRVGNTIKRKVEEGKTKTVSGGLVRSVVGDLHTLCGISPVPTFAAIDSALRQYDAWRVQKREENKNKPHSQESATDDVEEAEEVEDVEENEQESDQEEDE